jgi:hypothetical protein
MESKMFPMLTVIVTTHIIDEDDEKLAAKAMAKVQKLLRPLVQSGEIQLKVTEEISDYENA